MNSGINYSIVDPIINRIYGNTFDQKSIQPNPRNQQVFPLHPCDQQGFCCNPSNQPSYLKVGCDDFVLDHNRLGKYPCNIMIKFKNVRSLVPYYSNKNQQKKNWWKTIIIMKNLLFP